MFSPSPEPEAVGSSSENCSHIKKLGCIVGKHVNLYGEHMVLVSDVFDDGDRVAVLAVSASNPTERKTELPLSILAGWEDLFLEPADPTISGPAAARGRPVHPAGEQGSEQSGQEKSQ
jgi:hypothetical protein